jgi:probable rRNA maturation factor
MIEIINKTSFLPDEALLKKIASQYTKKPIELIITTDEEIQEINKRYRNINKPTDVLSFPLNGGKKDPLGSIIISVDFVTKVAKELHHSLEDECTLLFIHGLLHLLGYDHEVDNGQMRKEEEKIIKQYNLPKSLIVRTHT